MGENSRYGGLVNRAIVMKLSFFFLVVFPAMLPQ